MGPEPIPLSLFFLQFCLGASNATQGKVLKMIRSFNIIIIARLFNTSFAQNFNFRLNYVLVDPGNLRRVQVVVLCDCSVIVVSQGTESDV